MHMYMQRGAFDVPLPAIFRRCALLAAVAAMFAAGGGCDQQEAAPRLPLRLDASTPEGKFERVLERLKSALADASAASASSGVNSNREVRSRLIPPSESEPRLLAHITIETTVGLDESQVRGIKPRPAPKGDAADALESAEESSAEVEDRRAALLAASQSRKEETFELVYENDRWKLTTTPAGEMERICLEYALDI